MTHASPFYQRRLLKDACATMFDRLAAASTRPWGKRDALLESAAAYGQSNGGAARMLLPRPFPTA